MTLYRQDAQKRMLCPSSTLHHSLMLNPSSQCYCITSEIGRQYHSLISKLFLILLDIVLECNLEDTDCPGLTMMDAQIFSPERKTDEALIFKNISQLVWKHDGSVKV